MDEDEEIIDIEDNKQEMANNESWDNDMDDESRELIKQMLAEEEFYYGRDTISTMEQKQKKQVDKKTKREGALSSASLPSHKTRWNEQEDDRLHEALAKYGYGNWKLISEHVKTRNPLQCKNHARHLQQSDKIQITTSKQPPTIPEQPQVEQQIKEKIEEDEDIDLSIDGDEPLELEETPVITETPQEEEIIKEDTTKEDIMEEEVEEVENIMEEEEEEEVINEPEEVEIPNQELVEMIPNHTHSNFSPYEINIEEKTQNPEWFKNKHSKTPERYLKIRNHMLSCWEACKPRYLTKTSARKGLKDCGDVNAIGRVHEYLESIGAINVDCITSAPRPPRRREVFVEQEFFDPQDLVIGYDGPRKRKVRNEVGEWVDPKELEGRVIEHQVIIRSDTKPKRVKKLNHQHYYGSNDFDRGHDPFRLVPTSDYSQELTAPFQVEISSDALLVMDFHSHLAHTEIIGLLGGNFIEREQVKVLQVKIVFPCKSTSTGIQCEMDPASEMQARELFTEKGYNVVGWYHSHPTFEPHPSIRDIENQTSYQTLFREEKTGDEPFIGVIVTPYDPEILSDHSQIQYLHISKEWNELHSFRVPYACQTTVIQSEQVSDDILNQLIQVLKEYKHYEYKVSMESSFGNQTRLEKLLNSIKVHVYFKEKQEFLNRIKELVLKEFV